MQHSPTKWARAYCFLLCLVLLCAAPAWADATLDFQLAGAAGGSISYAGGLNPLVGANIPIRVVTGAGTPFQDGSSLTITNGFLNFNTGNYGYTDTFGNLIFVGAGSFAITGTIASLGITNGTLLSGGFLGSSFDLSLGQAGLFLGSGQDTKHPALVSYFFGNYTPTWAFTGSILTPAAASQFANTGAFSVQARSVDILNTAVPEPASVVLLGTLLVGVGFVVHRRWNAAQLIRAA